MSLTSAFSLYCLLTLRKYRKSKLSTPKHIKRFTRDNLLNHDKPVQVCRNYTIGNSPQEIPSPQTRNLVPKHHRTVLMNGSFKNKWKQFLCTIITIKIFGTKYMMTISAFSRQSQDDGWGSQKCISDPDKSRLLILAVWTSQQEAGKDWLKWIAVLQYMKIVDDKESHKHHNLNPIHRR